MAKKTSTAQRALRPVGLRPTVQSTRPRPKDGLRWRRGGTVAQFKDGDEILVVRWHNPLGQTPNWEAEIVIVHAPANDDCDWTFQDWCGEDELWFWDDIDWWIPLSELGLRRRRAKKR